MGSLHLVKLFSMCLRLVEELGALYRHKFSDGEKVLLIADLE